jgi:hypothetical protein
MLEIYLNEIASKQSIHRATNQEKPETKDCYEKEKD